MLFNFFVKRFLQRLHDRLQNTTNPWDDAMVDAVRRPFRFFIWVIGITFAVDIIRQENPAPIFEVTDVAREVAIVAILAWFLIRAVSRIEINLVRRWEEGGMAMDRTTADAIAKLVRISIVITAGLVILQTLGINISGVLAFGGIGGIAVGFAAKDLLANFFGGLMIYLDRPFAVGDWIRSPDRDLEGTVEEIGWRLTRIRTFDKRPLYIPNSTFANIAVENPSRMSHRRIYETVGVRYDDASKLPRIVERVREMLRNHPEIASDQTLIVNFNQFAPSSLDFFVYTFTRTTDWIRYHEIKQDVLFRILEIIGEEGAEVAFPTSTVHVPEPLQLAGLPPSSES
ncbi:MAG TPA: mechanosensitive ion channel family protein [Thiotrichales bacterium]|nr:mechanosensitive ion channel family protein [Thiotrichales bacterium]